MDSYSFHFERMSNLDLHPLSLPVSRLSPAKSNSSIDQYTHHHNKGDSAYSSFSGGSSAPDYPSPFMPDDFHPHSLHYTDLKYVKAVYGTSILGSDSKSMDKLYRSMEAIAQQHQHDENNTRCPRVKDPTELSTPLTPPPPPVRLDSFVTTRNLETSRARQSPEGQHADNSSFRTQTTNTEVLGQRTDPVYGRWVSQHYQQDQLKQDVANKIPESATVLSRLPTQTSQPEQLQQTKGSQSEIQQKSSHSTYGVSVSGQQHAINPWHMAPNMISGSIQHKGQFYFVTGVYKSPETSIPQPQCVVKSSSPESHRQVEQQRAHSIMENMLKNAQVRKPSSPEGPNGKLFFQEEKKLSTTNEYTESSNNHVFNHFRQTEKTSQSVDDLEDSQRIMSMDTGRHHTTSHPIFYCGPQTSFSASDVIVNENDQNVHTKKDAPANSLMRQPLADVPTEKISKETTPLLYHLTGASRTSLMSKVKNEKNSRLASKDKKAGKESSNADSTHSDVSTEDKLNDFSYPCNTLDDSFTKYYKEKLKDAQTKVLRETSFKRKDLQLSRPNRIEQWSDKRLSVIPSGPSAQDVHSRLENPKQSHLPKLQETDKETLRNPSPEIEKEIEKETEKQKNFAQPQVPRIGSRKRLTPEQKKLSHSEPEKLHQLADRPIHMTCRSLSSETEVLLSDDHGLVASRRKMFETRGRALSASSLSKNNLKHLQHKALVAYMERKTGQKVAEPQQPAPQVSNQRPSTSGRHSDWGPRPHSANASSKKKLVRPHSAGRILDSSSTRSTQFTLAQPSVHSWQPNWREGPPPPSGKCASVENLLDEQEQPVTYRARSTSTPHPFPQIHAYFESSSAHDNDFVSAQVKAEKEATVYKHYAVSVPEQRQIRVMAPRGKSLEELGVSKIISSRALSKSSEQLHELPGKHELSGRERRDISFLIEKHKYTKKNQDCAPVTDLDKRTHEHQFFKEPSSLDHPSILLNSRARACSSPPAFSGSEFSAHVNYVPRCDDKPQVTLNGDGCNGREGSVTSYPRGISENNLGISKMKAVAQEQSPVVAEESPGDVSEVPRCNVDQEVALSLGVTTDPSLWILPPEIEDGNTGDDTASQLAVTGHPQDTQSTPCDEIEIVPNTGPDTESSPEVDTDQERKEKEKKCGPLVAENPDGDDSKHQPRWETLVQEVVSADQSLARILYPITNRKTALMLMEQLLSEDTLLMEEHYKKKQEQKSKKPEPTADSPEMTHVDEVNNSIAPNEDGITLTAQQQQRPCSTGADITEKKRQLIACIEKQLKSLEGLRSSLQGDERDNGTVGDAMEALVRECCAPAELERYTQFIGDLERVVNLLLCLSARLARVQNALSTVDENMDAEEKQSLDNRYHLLCKQREDAKDLKDNLDRRERMVSTFLAKQLTDIQLQDYRHFVQTKASLLIRQKDLDEKQRLGEEQLEALLNSIPP